MLNGEVDRRELELSHPNIHIIIVNDSFKRCVDHYIRDKGY